MNCSNDGPSGPSDVNYEISLINTFGGTNNDSGQSVVSTIDGGYHR